VLTKYLLEVDTFTFTLKAQVESLYYGVWMIRIGLTRSVHK